MDKIIRMYSDMEIKEKLESVLGDYCHERGMKVEEVFDVDWMIAWARSGFPELGNDTGDCKYAILLNPWVEQLRNAFID